MPLSIDIQCTVWPEILAGNVIWRIGGFGCVRGHHVSEEFWTPEVGEEWAYQCEVAMGNPNDV